MLGIPCRRKNPSELVKGPNPRVEIIDFDNLRDESGQTPPKLSKTAKIESVGRGLKAPLKARL
jgi:hypothetical protein